MFQQIPATKSSVNKRKLVHGVGVNDANYQVRPETGREMCPYYRKWAGMIERCYDPKSLKRRPTYIGCKVSLSWLKFSNFREWMVRQSWEGKQLDKDILSKNNKIYSIDTCCFVAPAVNQLLVGCDASRGKYPIGVYYDKFNNKYVAKVRDGGKDKFIGRFDTPEDAHASYIKQKSKIIRCAAKKQLPTVKAALLRIADEIEQGTYYRDQYKLP